MCAAGRPLWDEVTQEQCLERCDTHCTQIYGSCHCDHQCRVGSAPYKPYEAYIKTLQDGFRVGALSANPLVPWDNGWAYYAKEVSRITGTCFGVHDVDAEQMSCEAETVYCDMETHLWDRGMMTVGSTLLA